MTAEPMGSRINIQIVDDFIALQEELLKTIEDYDLNVSAICRFAEISRSTFYRKQKEASFTAAEMKKICQYINR